LVAAESVAALRQRAGLRVKLKFAEGVERAPVAPPELAIDHSADSALHGRWHGPVDKLTRWLAELPLEDVHIEPADLEDLFISYYEPPAGGAV
jgi:hypothetical protein